MLTMRAAIQALEEDPKRCFRIAAAAQKAERDVEVDVAAARKRPRGAAWVAGCPQLLEAPSADGLVLAGRASCEFDGLHGHLLRSTAGAARRFTNWVRPFG
jgi:hypothetical protein